MRGAPPGRPPHYDDVRREPRAFAARSLEALRHAAHPRRYGRDVSSWKRIAPIFPVSDLDASLTFYAQLGFNTRAYSGGGYGYVTRDEIEIHVGVVGEVHRASAY